MPRALLLAVVAIAACNRPKLTYEPRSPADLAPTGCYERERLELATGDLWWSQVAHGGTYVTPSVGGWSITHGPAIHQGHGGHGLVAYAGGQRLDAVGALERLGDRELLLGHQQQLEATAGAGRWYPVYRKTAVAGVLVGTPLTLVGSGLLFFDDSDTGAYTAIAGLSVLTVALLGHLGAVLTGPDYARHHQDRALLADRRVARRAAALALDHNRRVAARCRTSADLPMTERARKMIEPPQPSSTRHMYQAPADR